MVGILLTSGLEDIKNMTCDLSERGDQAICRFHISSLGLVALLVCMNGHIFYTYHRVKNWIAAKGVLGV